MLGKARFHRLILALSVIYGIEPYVVLKDIWGLDSRDVEKVSRWMADALIAAAVAEVRQPPKRGQFGYNSGRPRSVATAGFPRPHRQARIESKPRS